MGYLAEMKNEVQQFAEVISQALLVESEIIDEDWEVAGSTSCVFQDPDTIWNDDNSRICRHVLETKRALILSDPGENQLCQGCADRNQCFYTAGLYYPILLEGHCYGVISLAAFTPEQKQSITLNSYSFMKFTSKMAEILANRIQQRKVQDALHQTNEYLQTIISSVHEGIIACNAEGIITSLNETASRKLGISSSLATGRPVREILPFSLLTAALENGRDILEESVEYRRTDGTPLHLISSVNLVRQEDNILGAVESFNTDESLFRIAQRLMGSENTSSFSSIIGESQPLREVKIRAAAVANSPSTVLITGESGTGKELFARAIHSSSMRTSAPFIPVNCGAIPDSLLESELFGYEGGAFTGARSSGKPGLFEMAQGGTIFLDEVGDMPANLQIKLLRVLQEKTIQHIGSARQIPVDVRVIAATNQDLLKKMGEGTFREDLYYRLNVIPLTIPPLRKRPGDIPLLTDYLCQKYAAILGRQIDGISEEALSLFTSYSWPGNVRELENAIEYAVNYTLEGSVITAAALPQWMQQTADTSVLPGASGGAFHNGPEVSRRSIPSSLMQTEREQLASLLAQLGTGVDAKKEIAARMGISLATLYRKIKKYEL